jgi:hypothetical protein
MIDPGYLPKVAPLPVTPGPCSIEYDEQGQEVVVHLMVIEQ